MGNDYGPRRSIHCLKRGPHSGMREIDCNAQLFHATDDPATKVAETGICGLEASITEAVARIVSKLHDAQPDALEHIEEVELIFDRISALEVQHHRSLPPGLSSANVGGAARDADRVLLRSLDFKPLGDSLHGGPEILDRARGCQKHINASCNHARKVSAEPARLKKGRCCVNEDRPGRASRQRHAFPLPLTRIPNLTP